MECRGAGGAAARRASTGLVEGPHAGGVDAHLEPLGQHGVSLPRYDELRAVSTPRAMPTPAARPTPMVIRAAIQPVEPAGVPRIFAAIRSLVGSGCVVPC